MGRSVDDHRVILYQGSTCRDITAATASVELRDELDALSVEVSFTALRNNLNDKYAHWYNIAPGDKLRIVNGGAEVFSGVILEVGQDGSVRANDPGWYLSRSQIILQLDRAAAPDAVARMCAKAGIKAGRGGASAHPYLQGVVGRDAGEHPGGHPGHLHGGDRQDLHPAGAGGCLAGLSPAPDGCDALPQAGGQPGGI